LGGGAGGLGGDDSNKYLNDKYMSHGHWEKVVKN